MTRSPTVAETGELIANDVPGQVALHGRLSSGALLSLSIHGGSAAAPSGFAITITGTDGTLTITPAQPGHYPAWLMVRFRGTDGAASDLPVPGRYRLIPAWAPARPAAHIAALYREIAQAITDARIPLRHGLCITTGHSRPSSGPPEPRPPVARPAGRGRAA